jgi:hypothetical protein
MLVTRPINPSIAKDVLVNLRRPAVPDFVMATRLALLDAGLLDWVS